MAPNSTSKPEEFSIFRELSCLSSLLYIVSLSQLLCRKWSYVEATSAQAVRLNSFGRPVGARQVLVMPETLVCWAGVDSDKKARCTWLCPVNPVCSLCSKPKWAPGSVARNALQQSHRLKHLLLTLLRGRVT